MTWMKGISKSGKFPKKAFNGILTAMYPSENSNGTGLLQLEFQDETQVGIYGTDKAKITEEGVEVAGSLAQFQESLEALDVKPLWGVEGTEIVGFMTEPDLIGCKVWMQPLEEQTVGDDLQTKKSIFWGTVEKYEKVTQGSQAGTGKNKGRPSKDKPSQSPQSQQPNTELTDTLVETLASGAKSISELFVGLGKKYKVGELRAALDAMKTEGLVTEENNKWMMS